VQCGDPEGSKTLPSSPPEPIEGKRVQLAAAEFDLPVEDLEILSFSRRAERGKPQLHVARESLAIKGICTIDLFFSLGDFLIRNDDRVSRKEDVRVPSGYSKRRVFLMFPKASPVSSRV